MHTDLSPLTSLPFLDTIQAQCSNNTRFYINLIVFVLAPFHIVILWAFTSLFNFAIIVASWFIILQLNALIEGGEIMSCLQEYKYCLAANKV